MSFVVVFSTNEGGPYPPSVDVTFHTSQEDAENTFQTCLDSVGDDYSYVVMFKDGVRVKSWEGNMDDLE